MADDLRVQRLWKLSQSRLYGILDTGYVPWADLETTAVALAEGGCDLIQFRAKAVAPDRVEEAAGRLKRCLEGSGALFIVNDWPAIAANVGADGVHVGQDDGMIASLRLVLHPGQLLGRSTHSLAQAERAVEEGADYIGVGPIFPTATKPDYRPVGLSLIREVSRTITLPHFCIGGIKLENLAEVIDHGATRVVIVSGILQSPNPRAYCQQVLQHLRPLGLLA